MKKFHRSIVPDVLYQFRENIVLANVDFDSGFTHYVWMSCRPPTAGVAPLIQIGGVATVFTSFAVFKL